MSPKNPSPLEAIENSLPNGFHDGALYELSVDRYARQLTLIIGADISGNSPEDSRIRYRRCRVVISGLERLRVEEPFVAIAKDSRDEQIDSGALEGKRLRDAFSGPLPQDCFAHWFFINGTNSFVHIAGRSATFEWLE